MEQIYYTQCPMGYGLGASNGFQIKRIGAGYPPSGDVRHLALRAFLPASNGKALAPGTLRYRRVGHVSEIAWLEPRLREYETERGQWGRPGGHFAHGLRLDPEELRALEHWPAGLFGGRFWRRSDPEPSRGRRPEDLQVTRDDLIVPPEFEHLAPRIDLDPDTLARLLASVAEAVRSGRALFLIDEADRLSPRIAALTSAFPSVLRAELTFSTYHDRPEELSGYRIHGTVPSALINRTSLAGLGPIADLAAGRFEPSPPPPSWAHTLATWLTRRGPGDAEDWTRTSAWALRAHRPDDLATLWSDAWLDGLFGLAATIRPTAQAPESDADWRRFAGQVTWAASSGLVAELVPAFPPRWWRAIARDSVKDRSAHDAFWALVLAPATWEGTADADASSWGAVAASFWIRYRSPQREQVLNAALRRIAPADRLSRFLDGLIRSVPAESGQAALDWLGHRAEIEPDVLLPIRARVAVGVFRERETPDALEDVLRRAIDRRVALPTVLDLIADEAGSHEFGRAVADSVSRALEDADTEVRASYEAWALRRRASGGDDWLAPLLRRLFATEINRNDWDALGDRTPPGLRSTLARSCLDAASCPEAAAEAYLWAVEGLVLRLDEASRPTDSRDVMTYLDRVASPLGLALRYRDRGPRLRGWLHSSRDRIGLSPGSLGCLADAEVLTDLINGSCIPLTDELLSRLPAADRAAILDLLIDQQGGEFDRCESILGRCGRCWPSAFDPGAEGIDRLAIPLSRLLLQYVPDPDLWLDALRRVLDRVGQPAGAIVPWPRRGIASGIVAETCRLNADRASSWALRAALLRADDAYPALSGDVERELNGSAPRNAGDVVRRWIRSLDLGIHTARFFEVLLNICDGPRLAVIVPEFSGELRTLGPLHWWAGDRSNGEAPDLRDAFARLAPMAPLSTPRMLPAVDAWLYRRERSPAFSTVQDDPELLPELTDEPSQTAPSIREPGGDLTDRAQLRWNCIRSLTSFHWGGMTDEARWSELARWRTEGASGASPPISSLDPADRYDLLAWLLVALDHPGSDSYLLESLARWVVKGLGLQARGRLSASLGAIAAGGVEVSADRHRLARDLEHQMAMQLDE